MRFSTSIFLSVVFFAVSAVAVSGSDACLASDCQGLLLQTSNCSFPLQTATTITTEQATCVCYGAGFTDFLDEYVCLSKSVVNPPANHHTDASRACSRTTSPTSAVPPGTTSVRQTPSRQTRQRPLQLVIPLLWAPRALKIQGRTRTMVPPRLTSKIRSKRRRRRHRVWRMDAPGVLLVGCCSRLGLGFGESFESAVGVGGGRWRNVL